MRLLSIPNADCSQERRHATNIVTEQGSNKCWNGIIFSQHLGIYNEEFILFSWVLVWLYEDTFVLRSIYHAATFIPRVDHPSIRVV